MHSLRQLSKLALKQLLRNRLRSILTVLGVAIGMFLYAAVETMQSSLQSVTQSSPDDNTLVVYRENRFCPSTSRLPEHYQSEIERIDGVVEALPIQIAVNNCGASLDVITFRGVPTDSLQAYNPEIEITSGSFEEWQNRSDAALVGQHFAQRRGLQAGDQFEAVGVRVWVAGIISSPEPQDNNVAYVHLPFLQQASRVGLGIVTQFNVRVADAANLQTVAEQIDALFAADQAPTDTRPEKAFFAQTASELVELVGFTRWLGLGAVLAVLGLVANALLLAARSRVKESAILQTVGFSRSSVAQVMVWEGVFLGLVGGLLGSLSAALFFRVKSFTLGNEGLTLALSPQLPVILSGLVVAISLGLLASLWPAYVAARRPIVESLRSA